MKKKNILISFLIIFLVGFFFLTGCDKKKEKETTTESTQDVFVTIGNDKYPLYSKDELNGIHFLSNYVDFNTDRVGNTKSMSFNHDGKFSFEVRVNCEEEHSFEEVKSYLSEYEEKEKNVNKITYAYYEYKSDLGDDVHYYLLGNNDKTYSIIFFLGENPGDIEEVFMNQVSYSR